MIVRLIARTVGAAAIACVALVQAHAQQPSAAAVATAREILALKGGIEMFDPVLTGVIEHHKNLLLQVNPNLQRDLDEVATRLRQEFGSRMAEIHTEIARAYASQFTEQELKDALAFYKTPLGKKIIDAEPKALDEATKRVDEWAGKFAQEVVARLRTEMRRKGHQL